MKLFKRPAITSALLAGFCMLIFSFSGKKAGGDSFQIYVDGKLLVDQHVAAAKGASSLHLNQLSSKQKIDVYYSHCGKTGKNRTISIKNDQNKLLKEWKFTDVEGKSPMTCQVKDILALQKNKSGKLHLYYTAKELPGGHLLAVIDNNGEKTTKLTK